MLGPVDGRHAILYTAQARRLMALSRAVEVEATSGHLKRYQSADLHC